MPENTLPRTSGTAIDAQSAIPSRLLELMELVAASVHDAWARRRVREGWTWGVVRDDAAKTHPGLVGYAALPESEKEYDRATALETLQAIQSLGYSIEPVGPVAGAPDGTGAELTEARRKAKALRTAGELLDAYDFLGTALETWPKDLRLRQLMALVLADLGATARANELLSGLVDEGFDDEETVSLLARTHKDLWQHCAAQDERERHLRTAQALYAQAFAATRGYYPGVNAATLAVLAGQNDQAHVLAAAVRDICRQQLSDTRNAQADDRERYYLLATLAEVSLILNERDAAEALYAQAAALGRGRWKDIHSTRRNARLLCQALDIDDAAVEQALRIPAVAVFVGHNTDRPGRLRPRFPADDHVLEQAVKSALLRTLRARDIGFGFASAAPGADILFLEALGELGAERYMVLPFNKEAFVERNYGCDLDGRWRRRFETLYEDLAPRGRVVLASDWPVDTEDGFSDVSYTFTARYHHGLATLKAAQLETGLVPMAVWDGKEGDGPGGTASTVAAWVEAGLSVELIDLERLAGQREVPLPTCSEARQRRRVPEPGQGASGAFTPEIRAMLFADVVGYSTLRESHIPPFVEAFLGDVARVLHRNRYAPLAKNTWGDAIYAVFADVRTAGCFALELAELVVSTDWGSRGLPPELGLRISLHAGPVYACVDPVLGHSTYTGAHVSRAARIEPVTPRGSVYVSEAFAALAAADDVREFSCEYVGRIALAKKYGVFPLYRLIGAARDAGR